MRIQRYQRQVSEPNSAGGVLVSGAGTSELGGAEALDLLSRKSAELAELSMEARRSTDVMQRTLAYRTAYTSWYTQRSQDAAGYETLATDSAQALQQLGEQALKGVDDPLTQAAIQKEVLTFQSTQLIEAQRAQITQQSLWAKGELDRQLFVRRQEIAQAPGHERPRLMQQAHTIIAAATGVYITPVEGEKKLRAFVDGVYEDQLMVDVYRDPNRVLADVYGGKYADMSEATRQRIILTAEKRAEALREEEIAEMRRDETRQTRIRKEVQDFNFAEYYERVGQLPLSAFREALDQGEIRGEHYRQLYDKYQVVQAEGGIGNDELFNDMRRKAYRGELTVGEVLQNLSSEGGLNNQQGEDLQALLNAGHAVTRTADYKAAVDFLSRTLSRPLLEGLGGSTPQTNSMAALAERELYQRVLSAGDERQAMTIADDIVRRFKEANNMQAPKPRYQTLDAAKRAYRAGHLTDAEFNTEAEIHELILDQRGPPAGGSR